jgi:uroporphyrinogen-III synthase
VLLHSAVAARHLAAECDRLGIPRAAIALAALGQRIAAAAGEGWRELRAAAAPRDATLLALARDMCHDPPPG